MNDRLDLMNMTTSKMFQVVEAFDTEALTSVFGGIKEFAMFTKELANRDDSERVNENNANEIKLNIYREVTNLTQTITFDVRHNAEWRLLARISFITVASSKTIAVIDVNKDYKDGKIQATDTDEFGNDVCSYDRFMTDIDVAKTVHLLDWFKSYAKSDDSLLELKAIVKNEAAKHIKEWTF